MLKHQHLSLNEHNELSEVKKKQAPVTVCTTECQISSYVQSLTNIKEIFIFSLIITIKQLQSKQISLYRYIQPHIPS